VPEAEIAVENPATGAVIATVPAHTAEQVAAAVSRARAAQPAWRDLGFPGRARVLDRARRRLARGAERVIASIVAETGKPYEAAQMTELAYTLKALGFWARRAPAYLDDERVAPVSSLIKRRRLVTRYEPLGVVGVIGPWNFPLVNNFGDCVPALAAGNAVVLKPSELTPLTSLLMVGMLSEAGVPPGAFAVVTGGPETGEALVDHVDFLQFTGSAETGRAVLRRAAETLTPVGLELGGNDPMIVLADADLERAASAAVTYGMGGAGQACVAVERVYVEAAAHEPFARMVAAKAAALRVGPPLGPGSVDVGAITSAAGLATIEGQVSEALVSGARVLTGGRGAHVGGPGRFYPPTVVVEGDRASALVGEETFGPVLPIVAVADAEEAVALANDSPYGLSASVFSADVAKAEALARRLEVGACCVNDVQVNYFALELPMGGRKASGIGRRHGPEGIRRFCAQQSLLIRRVPPRGAAHRLPYRRVRTRAVARLIRLLYGR
jgi:acyl-CoA reductase-like NAD-dependent aldehyde dehydrogenase